MPKCLPQSRYLLSVWVNKYNPKTNNSIPLPDKWLAYGISALTSLKSSHSPPPFSPSMLWLCDDQLPNFLILQVRKLSPGRRHRWCSKLVSECGYYCSKQLTRWKRQGTITCIFVSSLQEVWDTHGTTAAHWMVDPRKIDPCPNLPHLVPVILFGGRTFADGCHPPDEVMQINCMDLKSNDSCPHKRPTEKHRPRKTSWRWRQRLEFCTTSQGRPGDLRSCREKAAWSSRALEDCSSVNTTVLQVSSPESSSVARKCIAICLQ